MDLYKIIQFQDIQVRNTQRFEEFQIVINNTIDKIKEIDPDMIIIPGDLFHQKTVLSPESFNLISDLIIKLRDYNTIIIPGNHDFNINNENRLDSLTPIFNLLSKLNIQHKIKYFTGKNIYEFNDINFYIHSQIDGNKKFNKNEIDNTKINIGIFHGVINGAINDFGFEFKEDKYNIDYFKLFDYTIAGDIHKAQWVSKTPPIWYGGSLVQQNHGENIDKHGITLWTIYNKEKYEHEFIEIKNEYGYHTIKLKNHLDILPDIILTDKIELRVLVDEKLTIHEERELQHNIKTKYSINKVTILHNQKKIIESRDTNQTLALINYQDVEVQNKVIEDYYKDSIDKNMIEQLCILNKEVNSKVRIKEDVLRNKILKLEKIKFDNLLIYDSEQEIDVSNLNGIIGITGLNGSGKSCLGVDIILWVLYNKIPKSTNKSKILNIYNIRNGYGELYFSIDDNKFKIRREINRKSKNAKVYFDIYNDKEYCYKPYTEVGDSKRDIDKLITKYFGTYEDTIFTIISPLDSISNVMEKNRIKKDVIGRFIGLDIFSDCYQIANKQSLELQSNIKLLSKENYENKIGEYNIELNKNNETVNILNNDRNDLSEKIIINTNNISDKKQRLKHIDNKRNKSLIISDIDNNLNKQDIFNKQVESIPKEIEVLTIESVNNDETIKSINIDELNDKISKNEKQISNIMSEYNNERRILIDDKLTVEYNNKIELLNNNLKTKQLELDEFKKQLNIINTDLTSIGGIVKEKKSQIDLIDKSYCKGVGEYSSCQFIVNAVKAKDELEQLKEKGKTLLTNKSELDNIINTKIKEIETINYDIKVLNESYKNNLYQIEKELQDKYNKQKEQYELDSIKFKQLKRKYDELVLKNKDISNEISSLNVKKENLINQIDLLKVNLLLLNRELEEAEKLEVIIEENKKINNEIISLESESKELSVKLRLIESKIKEKENENIKYNTLINECNKNNDKLKQLENNYKIYEYYLRLYSDDGISYIILKDLVPIMEETINKILSHICDFRIKLQVDNDDKEIYIYRYNKDDIIENVEDLLTSDFSSGFQRFIISLAIRVAYIELNTLSRFNIFIIDEGISTADRNNIIDVKIIFDYLKTMFDKVFIISHNDVIKDYYDNIIEVISEDGKSKISIS